jgi:general secretion pathway protein D
MSIFKNLGSLAGVPLLLGFLLPMGLGARSHHENVLLREAEEAEARKDWDAALQLYQQALAQDPHCMDCQIGLQRSRFEDGQVHLRRGRALREQGQLEPALAEFQKAFQLDPGTNVNLQEVAITTKMIEDAKKAPGQPAAERGLTPMEQQRRKTEERLRSIEGVPELKPIKREIETLKINNQPPRVLYETVGKLAGVNVIFDPQFTPSGGGHNSFNIDLSNTNLEDALDYLALITHTFWKPLSANAIFVTEDNPTKHRDFDTMAVRTFYLENPTTAQEFQEIVTAIRSITDCRRMYTAASLNAIVARCEVDKLALVEKLVHDLDKPKAEVLVDVLVLDVNTTHTRDLQASLVSGSGAGLTVPVAFTPSSITSTTSTGTSGTTGTTTSGVFTLGQVGHLSINDFSTTLPGALLNAVLSDADTRVLQSPQVRASDGGKATLNIGSKIPFASGSYQPGLVGTTGVSPLVQTSFQYADVGVNITLEPRVHGDNEISMHITVDISNETSTVDFGGLEEPVIGQKKSDTNIRVRDGEVTLLGGLMNNTDTDNSSGIPGLVNIPILGKLLFGQTHKERDREELLIAVIPHIVRTEQLDDLNTRGIATGTEQTVQVRYNHPVAPAPPLAETHPASPGIAPGASVLTVPVAPPANAPVVPAEPEVPGAQTGLRMSFTPTVLQAHPGDTVLPTLQVSAKEGVFSVGVHVKWDPKILRLNSITPGDFLTAGGQSISAPIDIRNDAGEATISLSRLPGASDVSGAGPLATFAFTAMAPGSTALTVTELTPKNSKQESLAVRLPSVTVSVK